MVITFGKKITILLLVGLTSGCAGKGLSDYFPTAAATAGAALCHPAGPGAAAACAGGAAAVVEATTPERQQALSDNPDIAAQQLRVQEREHYIDMILKYAFLLLVLLWFVPTPKDLLTRFIRRITDAGKQASPSERG